jgi:anti-anti-sigma factor
MEYAVRDSGDAVRVIMTGRLTFADIQPFKQVVGLMPDAQGRRFVIDLAGVSFIDSAAMGMLLMARDSAAQASVSLALTGAQGQVKRILDVAKFDTLFETAE